MFCCRKDLNESTHCRGWDFRFLYKAISDFLPRWNQRSKSQSPKTNSYKYDNHHSLLLCFTPANHLQSGYSNSTPMIHDMYTTPKLNPMSRPMLCQSKGVLNNHQTGLPNE